VVEQAEDEIAAINMALGASFAGVRAMTGTSAGDSRSWSRTFTLRHDGGARRDSHGQRPGPATGFPTRTEQGELQFLMSAGHGEFPRVIFARNAREAFYLTNRLRSRRAVPDAGLHSFRHVSCRHTVDIRRFRYEQDTIPGPSPAGDSLTSFPATNATPIPKQHHPARCAGEARHLVVTTAMSMTKKAILSRTR